MKSNARESFHSFGSILLASFFSLHINKADFDLRGRKLRGCECVMVVSVQAAPSLWGCVTVFRWLGRRLESFLARQPRASGLPAPQPTPGPGWARTVCQRLLILRLVAVDQYNQVDP